VRAGCPIGLSDHVGGSVEPAGEPVAMAMQLVKLALAAQKVDDARSPAEARPKA